MAKLILFEFQCNKCNHKFEKMIPSDQRVATCPECNESAYRLVSAPMLDPRMGVDLSMPTMADKWARKHEEMAKRSVEED